MRASLLNLVTLREDPAEAEIASHRLLMRAGYLSKSGAGLYLYAPLLKRVIDKITRIVADEIAAAGGLEVTMPIMQEQALWERSGRWATYQASRTMLTVVDRNGQKFGLAPTAEEVITDYAGSVLQSYKQLPVTFFQQHTKFRDEIRPRFGLMRVKEFIMMDAYSFHANEASLAQTYETMRAAYHRIFRRMGLEAFAVEADAGAIGGSGSHEFMVAADVGEDTILFSSASGYAANVERARGVMTAAKPWTCSALTEVHTPGSSSIESVVAVLKLDHGLDIDASRVIKTLIYRVELQPSGAGAVGHTIAVLVRGDREVNEVKLLNATRRMLPQQEVLAVRKLRDDEPVNLPIGYVGPGPGMYLPYTIADESLKGIGPTVVGANKKDYHLVGFDLERDAGPEVARSLSWDDITTYRAGDACPLSGAPLQERRGIEVGHVFKLGTKYSAAMKAEFMAEDGKRQPFVMGCYGIGSSRVAAAAVEQHHDADGITWPVSIAPFQCAVLPVGKPGDQAVESAAKGIYDQLRAAGIEVVLDDRDLKPGPKFKDWDLIGVPYRVVCGRGVAEGVVELKHRAGGAVETVPLAAAAERVVALIREALAKLM